MGRVASDDKEAPSKFGFAVSDQILFDENDQNIRYYEGKGFGFIFEAVISDLKAGKFTIFVPLLRTQPVLFSDPLRE